MAEETALTKPSASASVSHKKLYIGIGAGVGVLAVAAVALRLNALHKQKAGVVGTPIQTASAGVASPGNVVQVTPSQVAPQVAAAISQAAASGASPQDISEAETLASQVDATTGAPVSTAGQQARVTTNDPAPSGDLIIRSAASGSAPQIGGAEKDGIVTILDDTDVTFAKIAWPGGSRLPPATGFARKAFLALV